MALIKSTTNRNKKIQLILFFILINIIGSIIYNPQFLLANINPYFQVTDDSLIAYAPTRLGFDFAGCNTAIYGSGRTVTTVPTADTTLYAMWTPVAP